MVRSFGGDNAVVVAPGSGLGHRLGLHMLFSWCWSLFDVVLVLGLGLGWGLGFGLGLGLGFGFGLGLGSGFCWVLEEGVLILVNIPRVDAAGW